MGIESDQLVFDYLSRVGDLAQQRQLPSSARMRLVSRLRNEIGQRRAESPVDSPAAVRRILARLGTPDKVVVTAATADTPGGAPDGPPASVPLQRANGSEDRPRRPRRVIPKPRPTRTTTSSAPSPPHLAGAYELGDGAAPPDWWRVEGGPGGRFALGDGVPGFVGGVEIPELLKPPPKDAPKPEAARPTRQTGPAVEAADTVEDAETAHVAEDTAVTRRRPTRLTGWRNPLLLLAAGLLVVGAVLGNWLALGLGWLIAWASRRLTPTESKWAVMGMPGLIVAAGIVWLWGRTDGRWGDAVPVGHMSDAIAQTWPWVVRGAATASALFLIWRSQRER